LIAGLKSEPSRKLFSSGNPKSAIQNRDTPLEGWKAWRLGSREQEKTEIGGQRSEIRQDRRMG
jgi:hypothetical protein